MLCNSERGVLELHGGMMGLRTVMRERQFIAEMDYHRILDRNEPCSLLTVAAFLLLR